MKALICGLGSIGIRHFGILQRIGINDISAFRTGRSTHPYRPHHIDEFYSIYDAIANKPDFAIVCNPTSHHFQVAYELISHNIPVLIEKPACTSIEELHALRSLSKSHNTIAAVAMNMRYHPLIRHLKDTNLYRNIIGPPLQVTSHFGTYLPSWHPWEDYKNSYAALPELGGGTLLTHIHEIDYLQWLFGSAKKSYTFTSSASPLGTKVSEASTTLIEHPYSVISSITLNFYQKEPQRTLKIYSVNGQISLDLLKCTLQLSTLDNKTRHISIPNYSIDATYLHQDSDFVAVLKGSCSATLSTLDQHVSSLSIVGNNELSRSYF